MLVKKVQTKTSRVDFDEEVVKGAGMELLCSHRLQLTVERFNAAPMGADKFGIGFRE